MEDMIRKKLYSPCLNVAICFMQNVELSNIIEVGTQACSHHEGSIYVQRGGLWLGGGEY